MDRPKLLDLFCCAGGCSEGYRRAGFYPYGIDHKQQPHYPFQFIEMDALEAMSRLISGEALTFTDSRGLNEQTLDLSDFSAIHASPDCQGYSVSKSMKGTKGAEKIIPEVRQLLKKTGKLFVIENVLGSPLINPIELSGMSFGLKIIRRRLFELNGFDIILIPSPRQVKNYRDEGYLPYHHGTSVKRGHLPNIWTKPRLQEAMGIDWMNIKEMTQAIPPLYIEFIGKHLMKAILSEANV